ncbi:50S ribosomal protein L20 [candidate division WWE3 bacterium RIFCSPLOWO2_01_FULL_39_13]|uniref:Large ribosomal subunit protein bL20 n=1 Tax=candidate division WWE3 bacterium RIFCSPLOWO2_01_FULL_39_13 TaxID=1802624 RepID=A0A1F4V5K6_UNCKA|nr:MAG: 50S ribosomal protein L20 [candidate division WWE3 bacterium RIFCSPLOWO2_01_FULL_39_13]
MPRSKTGTVRTHRHKKILRATKGYSGTRSKLFKRAHEAFIRAGEHQFRGRKLRKRDMKKLWIMRLNAALRQIGTKYSLFIHALSKSEIKLDRKILSEIAIQYPEVFKKIVEKVKP